MNKFVLGTLRSFIKDYGLPVDYKLMVEQQTDLETGEMFLDEVTSTFKALLLPTTVTRKFAYDLTYLAANARFTYGGMFDKNTMAIVCYTSSLPTGYTNNDSVTINDAIYNIDSMFHHPLGLTGINLKAIV